jgi:anaerobic magnesium-protoporphyrin IX monomethyl ester cyclase
MQSARLPGLKDTRGSIPLSLLVIAASLRENGHTPHIIDFSTMDVPSAKNSDERTAYFLKYFQPVIDEHNILLIGITCFSTMHYPLTTELAQIVKTSNPSVKIATGGAHPTYFGKEILTHDQNFDFVAEGEGEDTFVLLADLIEAESKGEECEFTIKDIQALKYRDEDLKVSENVRVS